MKKPALNGSGMALSKSLYDFEYLSEGTSKVANPDKKYNLFGRPSLIPGVKYPISKEEERLLDLAWEHACNLSDRGLL